MGAGEVVARQLIEAGLALRDDEFAIAFGGPGSETVDTLLQGPEPVGQQGTDVVTGGGCACSERGCCLRCGGEGACGSQLGTGERGRLAEEEPGGAQPAGHQQPDGAGGSLTPCGDNPHGRQPVCFVGVDLGRAHTFAGPACLAVCQCGGWPRGDQVPGLVGAPSQVDAVTVQGQLGGEPAQLAPHVATHEHPGGGATQHMLRVQLPLVNVALVHRQHAVSAAGDGLPGL